MTDNEIIELYFSRSQDAIAETSRKYGGLCHSLADNILRCAEDTDECLNDTWLAAWNAIPPQRPSYFSAFLAKITRNLALSRLRKRSAEKRAGDSCGICIDELSECIPDRLNGRIAENAELRDTLNRFLDSLSKDARIIFLRRYWYVRTAAQIAEELSMKEGAVKMSLSRTRKKLREFLDEEDIL